ncbi:hypothetical protein FAZ19_14585 [Sphingobacterium alkalisoli]|uniref:Yip1 domain-containing protein n=1 Tax=Sphingobacterium alkalisoli TaxID=1874115 RepID=A0A4U0GYZ1_9SPHI|nr:hypothetical protein [Sphingobacterium alkalisoli]TJY64425.1 hypothetical protein FAZ19_14585 [Sphingobacterium alkalisoli]GGH21835.1 hypothetical protein GCM10011418_27970 [Sphingobacterium alkalisoli]
MKYNVGRLFVNPFEDCSEKILLAAGVIFFTVGGILAYYGQFDYHGILKVIPTNTYDLFSTFTHLLVNVLVLTLSLFSFGYSVNKKTRFIDVLNVVLIYFVVIYMIGLLSAVSFAKELTNNILKAIEDGDMKLSTISRSDMFLLLFFSLISLVLLLYFFYLIVVGLKFVINAKKFHHGVVIVLIVLVADVLCRFVNVKL